MADRSLADIKLRLQAAKAEVQSLYADTQQLTSMVESKVSSRTGTQARIDELLALDDRRLQQVKADADPRRAALQSLVCERIADIERENESFKGKM